MTINDNLFGLGSSGTLNDRLNALPEYLSGAFAPKFFSPGLSAWAPSSANISTRQIRGYDPVDEVAWLVSSATIYQGADPAVAISTGKGAPAAVTNVDTVKKMVRFGAKVYLIGLDAAAGLYKIWRADPAAGNTAFTWSDPVLTLSANATAIGPAMNADDSYIYVGEYSGATGPTGGPQVWRSADGTTWESVLQIPAADSKHIHAVAPDPYNPGHVWVSSGDGGAVALSRSTDYGETWSAVAAANQGWQGVQISFDADYVWVAGDSGVGTVFVVDRDDLTPKWASTNYHQFIPPTPLIGTATWNPGSVADGAMTSTTVTVAGAAVGEPVSAGFTVAVPAGCQLTAAVTATDTVTVTLTNHSGAPQDLASGTLRVTTSGGRYLQNAFYGIVDPNTGTYYCTTQNDGGTGSRYGLFYLPHAGGQMQVLEPLPYAVSGEMFIFNDRVWWFGYSHRLIG